jgi:hypothetical protein
VCICILFNTIQNMRMNKLKVLLPTSFSQALGPRPFTHTVSPGNGHEIGAMGVCIEEVALVYYLFPEGSSHRDSELQKRTRVNSSFT